MAHQSALWVEGKPYADRNSYFNRFTVPLLQKYFSDDGFAGVARHTPNWVENTQDGYEFVRIDGNDVTFRSGIFINISAAMRPEMQALASSKGRAVAVWNHRILIPNRNGDEYSIEMFSDDTCKSIVAYHDRSVYSFAPVMSYGGAGFRNISKQQTIYRTQDGIMHIVPYVCLAFFMWLEDNKEGGHDVSVWLQQVMGWEFDNKQGQD